MLFPEGTLSGSSIRVVRLVFMEHWHGLSHERGLTIPHRRPTRQSSTARLLMLTADATRTGPATSDYVFCPQLSRHNPTMFLSSFSTAFVSSNFFVLFFSRFALTDVEKQGSDHHLLCFSFASFRIANLSL